MIPYRITGAINLGVRSISAHQLRTILTTLGIVLVVGLVIVMLSVGEAARPQALEQPKNLGANTIWLRSTQPTKEPAQKQGVDMTAYGLTYNVLSRIRATIPTVAAATPMREFRKTIRFLDHKQEARVVSVTGDFLEQHHLQ